MLDSVYLHDVLIPAVPVPFDAQGKIDAPAQERYARWMAQQPIAGVAVGAHTGRGLRLAQIERAIHRLYFNPADGFIVWATHAARRLGLIAPGSGTIRFLDLARRGAESALDDRDHDPEAA